MVIVSTSLSTCPPALPYALHFSCAADYIAVSCLGGHHGETHSIQLAERPCRGPARFYAGTGRFTIGITGQDGITYHVHLTAAEAQQFVDFVDERT